MLVLVHERFKISSNISISLSCVLQNNLENSSFYDLKPAIDFYMKDLVTHISNIDF